MKVAENLEITENDKMLETAKMYTWSDEVNPKVETGGEMVTSVPENKLKVHKIGEDFTLSASGEDKDGTGKPELPLRASGRIPRDRKET